MAPSAGANGLCSFRVRTRGVRQAREGQLAPGSVRRRSARWPETDQLPRSGSGPPATTTVTSSGRAAGMRIRDLESGTS